MNDSTGFIVEDFSRFASRWNVVACCGRRNSLRGVLPGRLSCVGVAWTFERAGMPVLDLTSGRLLTGFGASKGRLWKRVPSDVFIVSGDTGRPIAITAFRSWRDQFP